MQHASQAARVRWSTTDDVPGYMWVPQVGSCARMAQVRGMAWRKAKGTKGPQDGFEAPKPS
eukprot:5409390-Prymnesium_polylepis.1